MIVASVESFTDNIETLKPILPEHHAELAIHPLEIPLDPKWDVYKARDADGQILFITLRKRGELIGYFIGFLVPSIHNDLKLCAMDIMYVRKHERMQGAGDLLFQTLDRECRRRGVGRIIVACKTHLPADDFFKRHDFSEIEHSYWKHI